MFARMFNAMFKLPRAGRESGSDVVVTARGVHVAWRIILDRLADFEPVLAHRASFGAVPILTRELDEAHSA
jgi:hypothetical protein